MHHTDSPKGTADEDVIPEDRLPSDISAGYASGVVPAGSTVSRGSAVSTTPAGSPTPAGSTGSATIYDIARAAGVSPGTASRALNRIGYVRLETRMRVEEAALRLRYTPNRAARTLKTMRTGLLLLAIPDTDNPFYVDMIDAVQTASRANGYSMLLTYTGGTASEEVRALRMLREHAADGMILVHFSLTARHRKEIERINAPVVLTNIGKGTLDGPFPGRADFIGVDAERGILLAARHLAQQGHDRIGYVAGPAGIGLFMERLDGYRAALRESGLPCDPELIRHCSYEEPCGHEAAAAFMALRRPPTAIVCANDILALGVLRHLQERGIRVPDDVSLVGMDDIPVTRMVRPRLSTVGLAQADIGRQAAELVFARLDGQVSKERETRILQPQLIVRESSVVYRQE